MTVRIAASLVRLARHTEGIRPNMNGRAYLLFSFVFAGVLLLIVFKAALDGDWHAVRAFGLLLLVFASLLLAIRWMGQRRS